MIYGNNGFDYPMPFSYKIIPLVYDEALSYWQQLCYFKETVDSIVTYLEGFGDSWKQGDAETLAAAKAYADSITSTFRSEFERYTAQIDAALRDMETQQNIWYHELKNDISGSAEGLRQEFLQEISGMERELSLLWLAMNYLYYQQDEKFTKLYTALKQYIDDSIAYTTGARVTVKNPVTGSITTLNAALSDLMNYIETIGSVTMRQYDSLKLTMAQYESYRITKREYRLRAYFIFFKLLQFGDFIDYVDKTFAELKETDAKTNARFELYNPYAAAVQDLKEYIKGNMAYSHGSPMKIEYENMKNKDFNRFDIYNTMNITKADYRNYGIGLYIANSFTMADDITEISIAPYVHKEYVSLNALWMPTGAIGESYTLMTSTLAELYNCVFITDGKINAELNRTAQKIEVRVTNLKQPTLIGYAMVMNIHLPYRESHVYGG